MRILVKQVFCIGNEDRSVVMGRYLKSSVVPRAGDRLSIEEHRIGIQEVHYKTHFHDEIVDAELIADYTHWLETADQLKSEFSGWFEIS